MKLPIPQSLRARLLLLLLVAIIGTAGTQAFFAYRTALSEADSIFDYQMQQMAASLRPGLQAGNGHDPGDMEENYDFVVQVWTSDGLRVFRSTAHAELPQRAVLGFSNVKARGTTYRIFSLASGTQVIQVAQDMTVRHAMAGDLALRTVKPMLAMVPLLMLLVWWVVSASLAPVARLRQQVATRQADDLSALGEQELPDEIQPLVREINLLFQRLRQAFDAEQNFVADAAHELRSPLAALKLQLQVLRRAADAGERDVAVTRLSAGIDRATRLVEQLLVLARQQAHADPAIQSAPVDMAALARQVMADAADATQLKGIQLELDSSGDCHMKAFEDALRILLHNLVDNAIKYTPQHGRVQLQLRGDAQQLVVRVNDSGPGIAEADRQRVLDRFYRVAGATGTGSGLGLAIVKTIADLHGASVVIGSSDTLGGLQASVTFNKSAAA